MLEKLCRNDLWRECRLVADNAPLVSLKGKPWKKETEFGDFFGEGYLHHNWDIFPINLLIRARTDDTRRLSLKYFSDNGGRIIKAFIETKHGSAEAAMRNAKTYDGLFEEFLGWFKERRNRFMEKTAMQLNEKKAEIANIKKIPRSHGGVASLLKVLTKTMQTRGATISAIAKVQYAVCMQAGIYIPDEFLTDVLVANEIMGG